MPYTKTYTKKSRKVKPRKKTYAKKAIQYKPKLYNNVSMGIGFPKKLTVTLRYSTAFAMSSNLGTVNHHQTRLNDIFDPDVTFPGTQPMYTDQYLALYNHFHVIGSKLDYQIISQEQNTVPINVAIWQNDDTFVTPARIQDLQEYGKSKAFIMGSVGNIVHRRTMKYSAKKTFGGSVLANNDLRGSVGGSPPEQTVSVVSIQSLNESSTASIYVKIDGYYTVVFTELKDIVGS